MLNLMERNMPFGLSILGNIYMAHLLGQTPSILGSALLCFTNVKDHGGMASMYLNLNFGTAFINQHSSQ
jgi:hypothetical protein